MTTNARLPFEATPEYQSLIEDMNRRIEAELRVLVNHLLSNRGTLTPSEVRLEEEKCMNRQTAISLEVKRKIAVLQAAYEDK